MSRIRRTTPLHLPSTLLARAPVAYAALVAYAAFVAFVGAGLAATAAHAGTPVTRIEASEDLLEELDARAGDDRVRVVIAIPAGTDAVWDHNEDGDEVAWVRRNGAHRVVPYLPYPGSYGRIPRTRSHDAEKDRSGALEALVLGPALARGAVVEARPVAVLRRRAGPAGGPVVLAVLPNTPLGEVRDLDELEERFPGVAGIVTTWFRHAEGDAAPEVLGLEGADAAWETLQEAAASYEGDRD